MSEGITRDRYGLRATVKCGGRQREKRYPFDTPIKTMQAWRDETRVALRAGKPAPTKDTLKADAVRYLAHMKSTLAKATYQSRVCEIEAWFPALGHLQRQQITRDQILDVRQAWLTPPKDSSISSTRGANQAVIGASAVAAAGNLSSKPKAPKTCNHRTRALRHLYRYLDGKRAPTPLDDIPKLKEPDAQPQLVDVRVIKRVASKLADPKTRGRFMVLASTGQRPAQLKRALPGDVDLRRGLWLVRPAKGGHPIPVILTDDMRAAWRVFTAADAWGHFDGSDYAKRLYAAGWPRSVRPYNAKHTVAITLANAGTEWEDVKDWFGHTDVKTTRIYTGQVLKRLRATSARLAGRIGW